MEEMALNWVDYGIGIIVLTCIVLGIISGFVMQLASILSVAAGIALSIFFSSDVAQFLGEKWIENSHVAKLAANILCFFGGATVVRIFAQLLSGIIKKCRLENFDRLFGAAMGFIKGIVICLVLLIIANKSKIEKFKKPVEESISGKYIIAGTDKVISWFKDEGILGDTEDAGKKLIEKSKEVYSSVKQKAQEKLEEKQAEEKTEEMQNGTKGEEEVAE